MDINNTCYINPYTFQPTSKRITSIENRREIAQLMWDETKVRPVSLDELMGGMGKPLNLANRTSVNMFSNSVNIAEGAKLIVSGGYVLTVKEYGVEISDGNPYDQTAKREAAEMASALTKLLRNAGGTANKVAFSDSEYQKWTQDVSKVMRYFGIDTSKTFTVNGMKYSKNGKGYFESASSTAAQEAYERQIALNRTYEFADERTKKKITYLSDYYLATVPEGVKQTWQETLEETGVNPFADNGNTLSQLAVEQDFLTGGNDKIFGNTIESSISAVEKILNRIENPLGKVTKERAEMLQQEKVFYKSFIEKLEHINDSTKEADSSYIRTSYKSSSVEAYFVSYTYSIRDSKETYETYQSDNYKIVPDNEAGCFDIYNKHGERLGAFSYSDIVIRQDAVTGKQFLISEHGTMSYDALVLDDELKNALKNIMGKDELETEKLKGYTLQTHPGTGIQYLLREGEEGRGGKVLLQTEEDIAKYETLAETYFNKYPNLIKDKNAAYIWADLEIKGLAKRAKQGLISMGYDGMSYNDNLDYQNNWSVVFGKGTYKAIYEYIRNNPMNISEMQKFYVWQDIFDMLGSSYERIW